MGLIVGMGHFMPPIVGVIGESTVAIPTLVRLFSGVSSHVIAQVKFRFEHFRANLTLILRNLHMVGHVNLQSGLLSERHPTNGALMLLPLRVHILHVIHHAVLSRERLHANFTLERGIAVLSGFMHVQIVGGEKLKATQRALEVFELILPPLMVNDLLPVGKSLVAHLTLFRLIRALKIRFLLIDPMGGLSVRY